MVMMPHVAFATTQSTDSYVLSLSLRDDGTKYAGNVRTSAPRVPLYSNSLVHPILQVSFSCILEIFQLS